MENNFDESSITYMKKIVNDFNNNNLNVDNISTDELYSRYEDIVVSGAYDVEQEKKAFNHED